MEAKLFDIANVIPIIRNGKVVKYMTTLTSDSLGFMYAGGKDEEGNDREGGFIVYNGENQRGTKLDAKGNEKDVFSPKHVNDIYNALLSNKIHGGVITLNYNTENKLNEEIKYNEKEQKLEILGVLDILDGQHRVKASAKWVQDYIKNKDMPKNPKSYEFPVLIEMLNNEQAKMLFSEYSRTPLKISPCRAEYLNVEDVANKITNDLINKSELKGKVELIKTAVSKNDNKVTTFKVLISAIRQNFAPETTEETKEVTNYLVEFFNYLVQLFPKALGNVKLEVRQTEKSKSFANELATFYAYIKLAKELKDDKDWKRKLDKLKQEQTIGNWTGLFLDKSNPIWKGNVLKEGNKIISGSSAQAFLVKAISEYILGREEKIEFIA